MYAGLARSTAADLSFANPESATPPVATYGSPSGAPIARWRETGSPDSRDAFVMNVLAGCSG
jgi:hypothetical protein